MTENITYGDDEKLSSILDVLKQAGLFDKIVAIKTLVNDDEIDTEEDDWVDIQTKYGHDTQDYVFADRSETRAGTYSVDVEPVSGHDWVGSVTMRTEPRLHTNMTGESMCGKPLTECTNFNCIHKTISYEHIWEQDDRYEFKQDWNSMADRPSPDFMMGLPGLRYIEIDQTHFTRLNTVCNECHLYTPTRLETCQNCDRILV